MSAKIQGARPPIRTTNASHPPKSERARTVVDDLSTCTSGRNLITVPHDSQSKGGGSRTDTAGTRTPYLHLCTHPQGGAITIPSTGNVGGKSHDSVYLIATNRNRQTATGWFQSKSWPNARRRGDSNPFISAGTRQRSLVATVDSLRRHWPHEDTEGNT